MSRPTPPQRTHRPLSLLAQHDLGARNSGALTARAREDLGSTFLRRRRRRPGRPHDWWDPAIAVAGLLVGVVVGLTGMGGGALMTPVLVFFFGVPPLAAVSSDVVASFFMKPIGGVVHLRRGTVHLGLVKWLCLGSVPGAFAGVLLLRLLGRRRRRPGDPAGLARRRPRARLAGDGGQVLPQAAGPRAAPRERGGRRRRTGRCGRSRVRRLATVLVGFAGGAGGRA